MGHLKDVEQELRELLHSADEDAVVRFVLDQVLASYRNGQSARQPAAADRGNGKRPGWRPRRVASRPQHDERDE